MPRGALYYNQHDMEFAAGHTASTFRTFHNHHHQFSGHLHHHQQQQQPTALQRLGLDGHTLLSSTAALSLQHHLQYLRYSEPLELTACPLDLSLKNNNHHDHHQAVPITPPCTPSPGLKRNQQQNDHGCDEDKSKTCQDIELVPGNPSKKKSAPLTTASPLKKNKATRKLNFDEDNSSPVSGTIIRELRPDENLVVRKGDIDPAFNVVEITEEAKAELARIENHIGDYVCRLCKELYEDAFGLAQHRCSRIVHVEYRCPECDKVFNCPANLASHRRWHKPRPNNKDQNIISNLSLTPKEDHGIMSEDDSNPMTVASSEQFPCADCGKKFRRIAYLRKHQAVHQMD